MSSRWNNGAEIGAAGMPDTTRGEFKRIALAFNRLRAATQIAVSMGELREAASEYLQATETVPVETETEQAPPEPMRYDDAMHALNSFLKELPWQAATVEQVIRIRDLSIAALAAHFRRQKIADTRLTDSDGDTLARLGIDAELWAREFTVNAERLGMFVDQSWMVAWFANAIEQSARIHPDVRRLKAKIILAQQMLEKGTVSASIREVEKWAL